MSKLSTLEPLDNAFADEVNKTADNFIKDNEMKEADHRTKDGLSDNLQPFKSEISDNLGVADNDIDDHSPRFNKGENAKGFPEDDASISLT